MTDQAVTQLKSAASAAGQDVKNAALAQINKQEGWAKKNLKPLLIGIALGLVAGWVLHAVL